MTQSSRSRQRHLNLRSTQYGATGAAAMLADAARLDAEPRFVLSKLLGGGSGAGGFVGSYINMCTRVTRSRLNFQECTPGPTSTPPLEFTLEAADLAVPVDVGALPLGPDTMVHRRHQCVFGVWYRLGRSWVCAWRRRMAVRGAIATTATAEPRSRTCHLGQRMAVRAGDAEKRVTVKARAGGVATRRNKAVTPPHPISSILD